MTTVISVEGLSKQYRLGTIGTGTLFRDFERWRARVRGRPDPYARIGEADHGNRDGELVWALKDVSFAVREGEVLGIIGRNGAGKSTLLKILSRVTAPTGGQVKVKGRIASLLEVGTGFHPELTGRENIFLNGAILGMTRAEVRRKLDEIVDFAGVEQYLDTPVKRYSSGMYVRLAFAVAAHLEPEILIVDEVLAVGDAEFQKKCLGKMGEVARGGKTVLFVSHNMAAVRKLCSTGVFLERGSMIATEPIDRAIMRYFGDDRAGSEMRSFHLRHASHEVELVSVLLEKRVILSGDSLEIELIWLSNCELQIAIEVVLKDHLRCPIAFFGTGILEGYEIRIKEGMNRVRVVYPSLALARGIYFLDVAAAKTNKKFFVYAEDAISFEVEYSDLCGSGFEFIQGNGCMYIPCSLKHDSEIIEL